MNEITSLTAGSYGLPRAPEAAKIEFPPEFTDEQKRAMEVLVSGAGIGKAAEASGVHRTTVRRWLDGNQSFRRAYFKERGKKLDGVRRATLPVASEAALTVITAVREGNVWAAMAVLKAVGAFDEGETRSSKPESPIEESPRGHQIRNPNVQDPGAPGTKPEGAPATQGQPE